VVAAKQDASYELLLVQGTIRRREAFTHPLANLEIVAVVSDSVDRMFARGTIMYDYFT